MSDTAVTPQLLSALQLLEYRGYDSAGLATLEDGHLRRCRAKGHLINLQSRVKDEQLSGRIGIAHTRWATHGRANENNAHPHIAGKVAVVHNGIIENFAALRREIGERGAAVQTETDTEIVAHLVNNELARGLDPVNAVAATLPRLRGAFALLFLFDGEENLLVAARQGPPLVIGYSDGAKYVGSDGAALAVFASAVCYLENGDWAVIRRENIEIRDLSGALVDRPITKPAGFQYALDKNGQPHFMAKEIHEQPMVVARTLEHYLVEPGRSSIKPLSTPFDLAQIQQISISGCGTAYYAGLVAKHWLQRLAKIWPDSEVASEFRYRTPTGKSDRLSILISQSGETADTLAGLRYARDNGDHTLCVLNVISSTMARESEFVLPTLAGPEIGVASTKAFTCQLMTLACLVLALAHARQTLSPEDEQVLTAELLRVPTLMAQALALEPQIERLAPLLAKSSSAVFLGRGTSFSIALEGALKLKELSYIHAEGFAAGELKHGPIALIDHRVPVIVIAPSDSHLEKTVSNVQEVAARGGRIILITDSKEMNDLVETTACLLLPKMDSFITPFVYSVPVQLIAYHTALALGNDVDRPRNLAKSVTVE